jgi:hypothetical protein
VFHSDVPNNLGAHVTWHSRWQTYEGVPKDSSAQENTCTLCLIVRCRIIWGPMWGDTSGHKHKSGGARDFGPPKVPIHLCVRRRLGGHVRWQKK